MGKTARWFRALLGGGGSGGGKKDPSSSSSSTSKPTKEKKRWSFVRSLKDKDRPEQPPPPAPLRQTKGSYRETPSSSSTTTYNYEGNDPNKHAIAVAAATAAVAEAAVAAAQAAAAVVKLTSSGRCTTAYLRKEDYAAVLIQSAFRGYLAKRALKALKGLVKLQALVRGHIIRKNTAEQMKCLQAVVRVQSRARAGRIHISEAQHLSTKPSISHHPGPATPEKYERTYRSNSTSSTRHDRSNSTSSTRNDRSSPLKRNSSKANNKDGFQWDKTQLGRNCLDGRRMDERSWDYYRDTQIKYGPTDDEKSDKILEIDPGKPHLGAKHRNISPSSQHPVVLDRSSYMDSPSKDSTTAHLSSSSISSGEVQSRNPQRLPPVGDDEAFCTAENSPQFYSASSIAGSSRRGPFTPTKSDCSRSFLSAYSDHPNYMANTESSRAKVRSQSAPKQRLEFEKSNSGRRYNVHAFHGFGDVRLPTAQRVSAIQASFTSKAYPGSGRLDRLGMPIQRDPVGDSGVHRYRF